MDKKIFDEILKQNVVNTSGVNLFGYYINEKIYPNHYNNYAFEIFVNQMMLNYPEHHKSYSQGKGNELTPQKGKYGFQPPKMSSVASSSRFCYISLRNGAQALGGSGAVVFEHPCRIDKIKGGTSPQMDAYIENGNIFVEVKCHEIFDLHKIEFSAQYYDLIFDPNNDFGFEIVPADKNAAFKIPVSAFGLNDERPMIDIKQLICHLLGIKSHKNQDETATLVYLFFKPKVNLETQKKEIDALFEKLKTEITTIFGSDTSPIKKFAKRNNIQLKAIAQYSKMMSPLTKENMIALYV